MQYLDYMKLDEPIIGLSFLEELPSDPQSGPRYKCTLCNQTANLPETVRHLIGRKHRQKYVELKRPDLVTWDKLSIIHQGGKIIRARAEIIERQDGRGTPSALPKRRNAGQLNNPRARPRQNQNQGPNIPQRAAQERPHLPRLMDYQKEYYQQGRFSAERLNTPLAHPDDPYMTSMEEGPRRADYRDSDMYRREYTDPNYHREYEEEHVEQQRRAPLGTGGGPQYDSREEMTQLRTRDDYPDEASYRRPYPQRDLLKEFYSEEVRRRQALSAERPHLQPGNQEDGEHHWSLQRDSVKPESMNRAGRQCSGETEANRRSFPTQMEAERSRDSPFNVSRDYLDEMRKPYQEETAMNPGLIRTGPPQPQRRVEVTRTISEIPEPFRRFLEGPSNDEQQNGKRKRKSRFSDATAEEVETTKELYSVELGPPNPKFVAYPRPVGRPPRPEIHEMQHPDLNIQPQSTHQAEGNQTEGSDSGHVFDMLKNIEIENAEEAMFLKSKLCDLLKEFENKKSQKAARQNSQERAIMSKDFGGFNMSPELAPKHRYEPGTRQDSDHRRPEELYYQEDHRGRGREYEDIIPDERLQEYGHPVREEARQLNRSHHEEDFGWQETSRTPHASHEAARFPERFQEARHSRDYRPASVDHEFLDSHSPAPAPSLCYEQGPRLDRGPRYYNNLDKITSTLLELVARK
ncbi:uncharacterized protein LOC141802737 isoform X2 [Halichoeres trimaculatus]